MDGRDHVRRAIRHYLEKDEDLTEDPEDQVRLNAAIQAAFVLARASVAAGRDVRDMVLRLEPGLPGRPSSLHRHYEAVWTFLGALWELIDFCELEQEVASSDVADPVWFFGRALDQHLGGNPFEALAILDEAGLSGERDSWIQMLRAEALAAGGEQAEAIASWEKAAELDPLLVPAHVAVAGELEALGKDREAYVHWLAVRNAVGRWEPLAEEAKRHLARLRLRLAPPKPEGRAERYGRLPRWGPSWVPAWPGRGLSGPGPGTGPVAPAGADEAAGTPLSLPEAVEDQPPAVLPARPQPLKGFFRVGRLEAVLGFGSAPGRDLRVFVIGGDPVSDGLTRSRSAVFVGGGRLVGSAVWDPEAVDREEPDVVLLASGASAERAAAIAERARVGTLHSSSGDEVVFLYNGPAGLREDLETIFEGLQLEYIPDICPPTPDMDLDPACLAELPAQADGSDTDEVDPLAPTIEAIAEKVKARLGGKSAPRSAIARGAMGLAPVLEGLDTAGRKHGGRTQPFELITVDAQPHSVEAVAIHGDRVAGASFAPGGEDRGQLLEELFNEMPKVLPAGELALLMGRLLGEGGSGPITDETEAFVAASLTAGVLSRAMLELRQAVSPDTSYGLRAGHLLVGGSLLSRLPRPEHALLVAVDGCQPSGVTRVLLDPYGIVTALGEGLLTGRVTPEEPSWADGTASLLAGSCVCVAPLVQAVKWGKPGRKLVLEATVKGAWRDGERTWELCRGELLWIPLPAGRRVDLTVRPAPPYNVGPGRGVEWRGDFVAGGLGLLLDGRGRPLRLPADEAGRTTLRAAWASAFVGTARSA